MNPITAFAAANLVMGFCLRFKVTTCSSYSLNFLRQQVDSLVSEKKACAERKTQTLSKDIIKMGNDDRT